MRQLHLITFAIVPINANFIVRSGNIVARNQSTPRLIAKTIDVGTISCFVKVVIVDEGLAILARVSAIADVN